MVSIHQADRCKVLRTVQSISLLLIRWEYCHLPTEHKWKKCFPPPPFSPQLSKAAADPCSGGGNNFLSLVAEGGKETTMPSKCQLHINSALAKLSWVLSGHPCPLVATACGLPVPTGWSKDHTWQCCQVTGERQVGALPSPVTREPVAPTEIIFLSPGLKSSLEVIFKLVFWNRAKSPSLSFQAGERVFPKMHLSKKKKKLNTACQGELSVSVFFFFFEWLFGCRQEASEPFWKTGEKKWKKKSFTSLGRHLRNSQAWGHFECQESRVLN